MLDVSWGNARLSQVVHNMEVELKRLEFKRREEALKRRKGSGGPPPPPKPRDWRARKRLSTGGNPGNYV